MPIYRTFAVENLMNECRDIPACATLVGSLNKQKPLGANYSHSRNEHDGTIKNDTITYKFERVFREYHYSNGFFAFFQAKGKTRFVQTECTFEEHFQINNLQNGCKLMVSETQDNMIKQLKLLKEKHEKEELKRLLAS